MRINHFASFSCVVIMQFLVLILALPAFTACANLRLSTSWTFNTSAFFADLNEHVLQDINEAPGFGVDTVGFSIPIKEKGITLTLEQGEVKQISNITYTPPMDIVYAMFPGAYTTYTIGKTVLEYRFLISENGTSDITTGYVTFEVSGVKYNIMVVTFNTTTGNYTAEVMKEKISEMGNLESIKLTSHPIENLERYMEKVHQLYSLDMANEATSAFDLYLDYNIDRMDVFKYIGRKAN